LLTETLGFQLVQQNGNRYRYAIASGEPGAIVDVLCAPEESAGRVSVGTVHHIAWRTRDDEQQRSFCKRACVVNVVAYLTWPFVKVCQTDKGSSKISLRGSFEMRS
jgi:hypothetical protein